MAETVDINGHPTWIDQRGSGNESILILHGGLSNSDALEALTHTLAERYRVVAFDRRGHGRTADTDEAFHYDDMVTEAIGVIEQVVGGPAHLIGWSDGGIIALLLAMRRADLINRMVLIGANFTTRACCRSTWTRRSSMACGSRTSSGRRTATHTSIRTSARQ